jgi:hypothetical protein
MSYTETQKFRQAWLWILIIISALVPIAIFGAGFYRQIIQGQPFGNHPASDTGLIIGSALVVVFTVSLLLLFGTIKLTTMIDNKGISYRFFPFHLQYRTIRWEEIEKYEVIQYNPLADYGGWGIRYGKGGKAYNVSGDRGLKLYLRSGRNLMIGTQREEEMRGFLLNLKAPGQQGT